MAVAFVSRPASGINGSVSSTTLTPNSDFAGGLIVGRFYIAWVHVLVAGQTINFTGTGWVLGDRIIGSSTHSSCWAYMTYSGSEAGAPIFTWSSAGVCHSGNTSWSGVVASKIGNIKQASGDSASIAIGTVAKSATGGAFCSMALAGASNPPPVPTNYTNADNLSDAFASEQISYELENCDSATVSITSGQWNAFLVEILGTTPATAPFMVPSGSANVRRIISWTAY